jgi:hypothetical protein
MVEGCIVGLIVGLILLFGRELGIIEGTFVGTREG